MSERIIELDRKARCRLCGFEYDPDEEVILEENGQVRCIETFDCERLRGLHK